VEAARSDALTGPVATLVLAGSAALLFAVGDAIGFRSAGAEALFVASWLLGWTLLAWATILGGVCAVGLVRRLVSRRGPAWPEVALSVAGAAVVLAVIWTHPLWGSGSGSG
jgi:hypothetical protein